jgi:3-oxoacyl-[acyl-carrier-protein] synthase-3
MGIALFNELPPVGLTGLGHALPTQIRLNDDPVFEPLKRDSEFSNLFTGYRERRVLSQGGSLSALMSDAAVTALHAAKLEPSAVNLLTGFASVSEFLAPNELYQLHRNLQLPESAEVLPIADEFTPFLSGIRVSAERLWCSAPEAMAASLVVCGCHWTANLDYRDPVSISIGDAAGAAVVQRLRSRERSANALRLLGCHSAVPRELYGVMRMTPRAGEALSALREPAASSRPLFAMLPASARVFQQWGVTAPPKLAHELIAAAAVPASEVTLIAHQASRYLLRLARGASPDALSRHLGIAREYDVGLDPRHAFVAFNPDSDPVCFAAWPWAGNSCQCLPASALGLIAARSTFSLLNQPPACPLLPRRD